jgi:hypothetical protein
VVVVSLLFGKLFLVHCPSHLSLFPLHFAFSLAISFEQTAKLTAALSDFRFFTPRAESCLLQIAATPEKAAHHAALSDLTHSTVASKVNCKVPFPRPMLYHKKSEITEVTLQKHILLLLSINS